MSVLVSNEKRSLLLDDFVVELESADVLFRWYDDDDDGDGDDEVSEQSSISDDGVVSSFSIIRNALLNDFAACAYWRRSM